MNIKGILAISGKPGLYKLVAQSKNGIIVEALSENKRFPVSATSNVSSMEDIAIYTYEEEVPLKEVFQKIMDKEEGGKALSHKESTDQIVAYFSDVLPNYDAERVYISDMKKVLQWYNLLADTSLLTEEDPDAQAESTETAESTEEA
ncbi:MAG: hypothetical protein SchgKO_21200 [Schleiferiaceae bacterium]